MSAAVCVSRNGSTNVQNKVLYQAFSWILIDFIVELLGLNITPFDNQTES
jgi:hypothetical protein